MDAISIASSGLMAATLRLSASASNIANLDSRGSADPAQPPVPYAPVTVTQLPLQGGGVAASVRRSTTPWSPAFQPDSPFADAAGMIALPNIDLARETVEQVSAMAAFRANLSVIRTADEMTKRLLDTTA